MLIDPPHYHEFYPNMSEIKWKSDPSWDPGWTSGLHSVANKSLHNIYGDFDAFHISPSQPLNFSGLDFDHLVMDSHGAINYLAFWGLVMFLFLIAGYCWCCCKTCCCCCNLCSCLTCLLPNDEKKRSRKISIIIAVLMGIWLIIFLFLIRHTIATNNQMNEAVNSIHKEMNKTVRDIDLYLETTRRQIRYTFETCLWSLRDKIDHVLDQCTGAGCGLVLDKLTEVVRKALDTTSEYVTKHSTELGMALANVQAKLIKVEKETKDKFETTLVDFNSGMYGFFMSVNTLYCLLLVAVLVGTIFLTFGPGKCLKTIASIILRCSIIAMFVLGIVAVLQLVTMFIAVGVTSQIICPAIRKLEKSSSLEHHFMQKRFIPGGSDLMKIKPYKVPEYDIILRGCKHDLSAYKAFNMKQAYDVRDITNLTDAYFNIDISGIMSGIVKHLQNIPGLSASQVANIRSQLGGAMGGGGNLMQNLNRNPASLSNHMTNMKPDPDQLSQLTAVNPGNIPPNVLAQLGNNQDMSRFPLIMSGNNLRNIGNFKLPRKRSPPKPPTDDLSIPPPVILNPIQTVEEIKAQVKHYTDFVAESIENNLGKCKPAYNAINATISLLCDKVTGPMISFWWILQFIPPTFILMIITAILLQTFD